MPGSTVIATPLLVNGLRSEFDNTYLATLNRQSSQMVNGLMDTINATNRYNEFGFYNASPHIRYFSYGDTIPQASFDSVSFRADAHPFGLSIEWHKYDIRDEQTASLFEMARQGGESAGLVRERILFDLQLGTTNMLPAVPLSADGVATYSDVDGAGNARFGITGGNIISGSGVTTLSSVLTNYYQALIRFGQMQDGQGQPLLSPETIAGGVVIQFGIANQMVFEQAFKQIRQGIGINASGVPATGSVIAGFGVSNVVQDASRNVQLWPTPRITDNDWFVTLLNPPKKPFFEFLRDPLEEHTALVSDNNSDRARQTGIEGIYWDMRTGGGSGLPYSTIKVNN